MHLSLMKDHYSFNYLLELVTDGVVVTSKTVHKLWKNMVSHIATVVQHNQ